MTGAEAREAMLSQSPVEYSGIQYRYISAIIYRSDKNGNLMISAELLDKNKNSVTIVRLQDVNLLS